MNSSIIRIKPIIFIVLLLAVIIGCSSSPEPLTGEGRAYAGDEGSELAIPDDLTGKGGARKLALIDPYEVGNVTMSTTTFTGIGLSKSKTSVQFVPMENDVILAFSYQGNTTTVFLDANQRVLVVGAIRQYLEEFAGRALKTTGKTEQLYGTIKPRMVWSMFSSYMSKGRATPTTRLGYDFVRRAPYFTITFPETPNEDHDATGKNYLQRSGFMRLYFTRSEATALADLLDQGFLEKNLAEELEMRRIRRDEVKANSQVNKTENTADVSASASSEVTAEAMDAEADSYAE